MSSHHFVKEGQEPALFIVNNFDFHHAEPLLEWVPLVMVADSVLETVLQWRIKIDVVIQHMYSSDQVMKLVKDQGPLQTVSWDGTSVVQRGLKYLIQNGFDAVNLLSNPDETIFQEVEKAADKLQVGIYGEREKWSLISTGKFEKWMPAKSLILIRSRYPVETQGIVNGGGSWETSGTGIVSVRSASPFWIGETP